MAAQAWGRLVPHHRGDAIDLVAETITFGRHPKSTIRCTSPFVSRHHFELSRGENALKLLNCSTTNRVNQSLPYHHHLHALQCACSPARLIFDPCPSATDIPQWRPRPAGGCRSNCSQCPERALPAKTVRKRRSDHRH